MGFSENQRSDDHSKASLIEDFVRHQTEEKQNIPPLRILVIGDDKHFNSFVNEYVGLLELDQGSEKKSDK